MMGVVRARGLRLGRRHSIGRNAVTAQGQRYLPGCPLGDWQSGSSTRHLSSRRCHLVSSVPLHTSSAVVVVVVNWSVFDVLLLIDVVFSLLARAFRHSFVRRGSCCKRRPNTAQHAGWPSTSVCGPLAQRHPWDRYQ
jgi:hypothetical protein